MWKLPYKKKIGAVSFTGGWAILFKKKKYGPFHWSCSSTYLHLPSLNYIQPGASHVHVTVELGSKTGTRVEALRLRNLLPHKSVAWFFTVLAGHDFSSAQKLGLFCEHFYCLHMPWRDGLQTFCNRPEVVFNCNGVLVWLCHFNPTAFSPLAKRPRQCPVSVSTLQLLIASRELPANLSGPKHPPAPTVKWVIFNTVTAPVMSANFSPWYNKASTILPLLRSQAAVLKFPPQQISTEHHAVPIWSNLICVSSG